MAQHLHFLHLDVNRAAIEALLPGLNGRGVSSAVTRTGNSLFSARLPSCPA
jgi:hypothetical protein